MSTTTAPSTSSITITSKEDNNDNNKYEYVFGFGSIMNSSTHAPWLQDSSTTPNNNMAAALPGRVVRIKGYQRWWNFRSATGFTALGVVVACDSDDDTPLACHMNGVLFQVPAASMPGFDRREVGYDKVAISWSDLEWCDNQNAAAIDKKEAPFELTELDKIWMYVPQASQCREPDENHPLLQSYVDTVLQGCLEFGGESMAQDFVLSTSGWSPFFLNDTPSSRRPWLFRKDYDIIDRILQTYAEQTHYLDRKHPEEFASTFLLRRMRGTWSLPRRNRHFTGREAALGQIHARLTTLTASTSSSSSSSSGNNHGGVNLLYVQGMGGVGKSSTCTEYCYRHFPSSYGLVIWLNAESSEALVADYRQLLADLAEGAASTNNNKDNSISPNTSSSSSNNNNDNNSTEEVIREVKTKLFRCQVPWLLVFDNLEDRKLLDKFVPRGAATGSKGHVLVTSRVGDLEYGSGSNALVLSCLSPSESLTMLRRALGPFEKECVSGQAKEQAAARDICEKLGHLPLALGMAAAYMQRCDVSCSEYVERYDRSEQTRRSLLRHQAGRLQDYSLTVSASLSLSLKAIENESTTASDILRLLCWLGPDQITKALLRGLISAKNRIDEEQQSNLSSTQAFGQGQLLSSTRARIILLTGLVIGGVTMMPMARSNRRLGYGLGFLATLSLAASMAELLSWRETRPSAPKDKVTLPPRRSSSDRLAFDEFEQSDSVWNILKSFSILTVKEGKGTIHRLLTQSLRMAHSDNEIYLNLKICTDAMSQIWRFRPKQAETWQESLYVVEHVKPLVSYIAEREQKICPKVAFQAGVLSKEAGVFSTMALNGFLEAEASLLLSLKIFELVSTKKQSDVLILQAKAESLHELGRVLRYQSSFTASEKYLLSSLFIREKLAKKDSLAKHFVADTLHELGVLEVKKHNLDIAETYLKKALDLRRTLYDQSGTKFAEIDADCAATLHQLAAVHVARKPPLLGKAEELLQEALKLSRQIGQRAATLKQLARVTMRHGLFETADAYLGKALELYIELYGERTMHINIAAVKFQQGALARQRDQVDQAWVHFSECLRIRRHVYAYAKPIESNDNRTQDPLHIEVSCVLHELGCVAYSQSRFPHALDVLNAERGILEKLEGEDSSSTHAERLLQARLTNLTWLRKCAKEMGNEKAFEQLTTEHSKLKRKVKVANKEHTCTEHGASLALQKEALQCRLEVRQFALAKDGNASQDRDAVLAKLSSLAKEIGRSSPGSMKNAAQEFHSCVLDCLQHEDGPVPRSSILQACDSLRDALRAHGAQVNDIILSE